MTNDLDLVELFSAGLTVKQSLVYAGILALFLIGVFVELTVVVMQKRDTAQIKKRMKSIETLMLLGFNDLSVRLSDEKLSDLLQDELEDSSEMIDELETENEKLVNEVADLKGK